jgi:hypothetical protein
MSRFEPRFLGHPDHSPVTIVTELSRLIVVLGKRWKPRNYLWFLRRVPSWEWTQVRKEQDVCANSRDTVVMTSVFDIGDTDCKMTKETSSPCHFLFLQQMSNRRVWFLAAVCLVLKALHKHPTEVQGSCRPNLNYRLYLYVWDTVDSNAETAEWPLGIDRRISGVLPPTGTWVEVCPQHIT